MTIHGGGKTTAYLQNTYPYSAATIHITNPNITVKMDNLTLTSNLPNDCTGILVEGADDTNLSDNNLELSYVVISNFGESGMVNVGGRVLMQYSLVYLNVGVFGGGVENTVGQNSNGSLAGASFIAKYSAISENQATGNGGGIFNAGHMDLRSTVLQDNTTTGQGGAIWVNGDLSNASCNVTRDVPSAAPSEIDDNVADQGFGIIASGVSCSLNDTIGSGNSSPYCTSTVFNCPQ